MRSLLTILFLVFGGASSGDPPVFTPVLRLSTRQQDLHMLTCDSFAAKEEIVQVHWKEKHANGSYSLIGVQNPLRGNHSTPHYKALVYLYWKGNATYTLVVGKEMVVCCETVTYHHGVSQESCVTIASEAASERLQPELVVVLSLGGFFFLGSFAILCYICWTRNRKVQQLGCEPQRDRKRRQTRPFPYKRTPYSRNLEYNPLSVENHTNHEMLNRGPRGYAQVHKSLAQRNRLPLLSPPPRNWQHHDTQHSGNQWQSEEPSNQEPSHPKSSTQWNFGYLKAPSSPDMIYSNVLRKQKTKVTRPSWSIPIRTSPCDVIINTRPLWSTASYSPEEVQPLPSSIAQDDSPLCTINPMYHSGTQWTSTQMGNNRQ